MEALTPVYCVYAYVMKDRNGHLGDWKEPCDKNGKLIRAFELTPIKTFTEKLKALEFSTKCDGYDHLVIHCGFKDGESWRGFRVGEQQIKS
jgi:hypothetical protein